MYIRYLLPKKETRPKYYFYNLLLAKVEKCVAKEWQASIQSCHTIMCELLCSVTWCVECERDVQDNFPIKLVSNKVESRETTAVKHTPSSTSYYPVILKKNPLTSIMITFYVPIFWVHCHAMHFSLATWKDKNRNIKPCNKYRLIGKGAFSTNNHEIYVLTRWYVASYLLAPVGETCYCWTSFSFSKEPGVRTLCHVFQINSPDL